MYVAGSAVAGIVLTVSLAAAADGYLGVYMQEVTASLRRGMDLPRGAGVLVSDVQEDSPADKAGVHEGDVITEIDGHTVGSADDVREAVRQAGAGHRVALTVYRDGDERTISVTLGSREDRDAEPEDQPRIQRLPDDDNDSGDDDAAPRRDIRIYRNRGDEDRAAPTPSRPGRSGGYLGIGLADLTPQLGAYFGVKGGGVLVTSVEDGSPADDAGLRAGDVIVSVGDDDVDSASDLRQAVRGRRPGSAVSIRVMRDHTARTLEAKLGRAPRAVSMLGPMDMSGMAGLRALEGLKGLQGMEGMQGFDQKHIDKMMKEWKEKSGKDGDPQIYVMPRVRTFRGDGNEADLHRELDRLRSRIDDLQKQIDEDEKGSADSDKDDDE